MYLEACVNSQYISLLAMTAHSADTNNVDTIHNVIMFIDSLTMIDITMLIL